MPRFSLGGFSTRNVDVLAVSATAGTCKTEPVKTFDPVTLRRSSSRTWSTSPARAARSRPAARSPRPSPSRASRRAWSASRRTSSSAGMQDSTPLTRWWEYPQFRVGIYQAPAAPPAFVDPTPLDQAELAAPAGGLLKVTKKGASRSSPRPATSPRAARSRSCSTRAARARRRSPGRPSCVRWQRAERDGHAQADQEAVQGAQGRQEEGHPGQDHRRGADHHRHPGRRQVAATPPTTSTRRRAAPAAALRTPGGRKAFPRKRLVAGLRHGNADRADNCIRGQAVACSCQRCAPPIGHPLSLTGVPIGGGRIRTGEPPRPKRGALPD